MSMAHSLYPCRLGRGFLLRLLAAGEVRGHSVSPGSACCSHLEQRVLNSAERDSEMGHLPVVFPSVLFPACSHPALYPSQASMPSPTL